MSIEVITNSPLDFGVDTTDQSVHYVNNEVLTSDLIANPFYVSANGGNLIKQEKKIIYTFETVIVVLNNGVSPDFITQFFSKTLKLENIFPRDCINFIRVSRDILFNQQFLFKANIVTDKNLQLLFPNDKFNSTEVIITFFELNKTEAEKYLKLYKTNSSLDNIKGSIDLCNYYSKYNSNQINNNMSRFIFDLTDSNFWTNPRNCKLNITNMFSVREFQSKTDNKFTLVQQAPEREKLANPDGESTYTPSNYKSEKFCDISAILKENKTGKRTFYASIPDNLYTEKDLIILLKSISNEKHLYELTNNILISKEYCHLLLKSEPLSYIQKILEKYSGAYKYSFGYAMLTLYLEECLFLSKSTKNSRFVFDINTANKLPLFPFLSQDLKHSPYVSIMINNEQLDLKKNCVGIKYIQDYDGYGVCDLETFKKRMNIFISGSSTKDIFNGLNWVNYAVSGSIIPACLQKRSPLYDAYLHEYKDEELSFKNFVQNYYGNSDIDLMCNIPTYLEYVEKSYDVYKLISANTESAPGDTKIDTVRTIGVTLTKLFFEETLNEFNDKYNLKWSTIEYEKNVKDMRVKLFLHSKYYSLKTKLNEQLYKTKGDIQNEFLIIFMQPLTLEQMAIYIVQDEDYDIAQKFKDTDFIFYQNDFRSIDTKVNKENKAIMKIGESIRFKLEFKKIGKTIELFKTANDDFFSTVAKFHLPCVRAYYNNSNVYILPSCIGAMMTGINIDYKYFAGIRDPYQIVIKYMRRGFGTILNKDEVAELEQHIIKNNLSQSYIGMKEVYSDIFTQFEQNKEYKYVETHDELKKIYKNNTIDLFKFNAISSSGNINQCKKSFFDLYYETS